MSFVHPFRETLNADYNLFLEGQLQRFPAENTLKMDLHCHDLNSDVPDELWGRILRLPETWLKTKDLVGCLQSHGTDVVTVTNHNNARSCWALEDAGVEVLPAAEFTCHFPDFEISVHVLCYGFSPLQEEVLKKLRKNIYRFMDYCREWNLPTVLPHPLYFYSPKYRPPVALFQKLALMFERFEVLNGQRDLWQNMLTVSWLESLTPDLLERWGKKHGIRPDTWCSDPYRKRMTGGSDDHMGLFAGSCGTLLHVPNLAERLKSQRKVDLVLEALRQGETAPFGFSGEEEKLNVAFLDYFCQVALNMEDPGLVRMFLHQGSLKDKLMCLAIGNGIQEIKRHRYTMRFFRIFHEALSGKRPGLLATLATARDYRPLLEEVDSLARARSQGPQAYMQTLRHGIPRIFQKVNGILADRLTQKFRQTLVAYQGPALNQLIQNLELPSHLRNLFGGEAAPVQSRTPDMVRLNLSEMFDRLSFPALTSILIAGSTFTSHKVLYNNRSFLNDFSKRLGRYEHPRRALWLTDTFDDANGVSSVLKMVHRELVGQDLPVDFLVCHASLKSEPHLTVVRPVAEFSIPGFPTQVFRVPDLLEVLRVFREGGYDRIICSTELLMGPIALFIKKAFQVPAFFYMHTDWLDYFRHNTQLDERGMDRVRRFLRAFYKQFEGVFVLNSDHRDWLLGSAMGLRRSRVLETAHWTDSRYTPKPLLRAEMGAGFTEETLVLLYVGRLSAEKGIWQLPDIFGRIQKQHPQARLVLAGSGPEEEALKAALPDALFLGWIPAAQLPEVYSSADFLLMPSRFDTFGCVVLEAMACGCPVAAFNTKGPRDILKHEVSGLLAETSEALADQVAACLGNPSLLGEMRRAALLRSGDYRATDILNRMLADLDLLPQAQGSWAPEEQETDLEMEDGGFFAEMWGLVEAQAESHVE